MSFANHHYPGDDVTTSASPRKKFYSQDWKEQMIIVTLVVVSTYLAVASIVYVIKNMTSRLRVANSILAVTSGLLLLESLWLEAETFIDDVTITYCTIFYVINVVVAVTTRTAIYALLWIRQRRLYLNPLQHLKSEAVKYVSDVTLVGILIFGGLQIVCLCAPQQYIIDEECTTEKLQGVNKVVVPIVFFISTLFQLVLLTLTLFPVIKHVCSSENVINQKLQDIVVRLTICSTICVVSDIIFMIISMGPPDDAPHNYLPVLYSYDTIINILATTSSFANYKKRFFPFLKEKERVPKNTPVATASMATNNAV